MFTITTTENAVSNISSLPPAQPHSPTNATATTQAPFNWRAHLRIHPAAELFPLMSEAELRELAEDIKKHGLQELPVIYRDPEWGVCILDGRNRVDALELIGWPTGVQACRTIRPEESFDPVAFVISKNIRRRHLTNEQKDELIAKLIKANPEKSNRQIAEQAKATHPHVGKNSGGTGKGGRRGNGFHVDRHYGP